MKDWRLTGPGTAPGRRPWPGALPWLVSLSAHAMLLAVATGWLPPRPPRLHATAMAELTVLGLPGDAPAAATVAPAHPLPARSAPLSKPDRATVAQPRAVLRRSALTAIVERTPLPLLLASQSSMALPVPPLLTGQAFAAPSEGSPAAPLEVPEAAASLSPAATTPAALPPAAARLAQPAALPAASASGDDSRVVPVAYLLTPAPAYPEQARRAGLEGLVRLRARVGADGRAEQLQVLTSSGSAELDAAALSGVSQWRFRPARRGNRELPAWLDIPVRFALDADPARPH